jgi:hypothetical protein
MGADLYLRSVFDKNRAIWEPKFDEAVKRRDALPEGSAEAAAAQKEVERCYEELYARGYFRDPYNPWDMLWKTGLFWWGDVLPKLDKDGLLSVEDTVELLAELKRREEQLEERIAKLSAEDQEYFRERYRALVAFLSEAIRAGEPIACSV